MGNKLKMPHCIWMKSWRVTKIWSGGVTDAQFHYREWVLNMNMIEVMKGEKCIVRWFYGSAQPSGWCRQFIAQEQWKRFPPMRKGMTSSLKQSNRFYLSPDKTVKPVRQVGE